jgi:hypothetical protein
MGLVGYCRLLFSGQGPIFNLPDKSWEMKMNWLFETYSNVYATAMGQRPFHHGRFDQSSDERRLSARRNVKKGM